MIQILCNSYFCAQESPSLCTLSSSLFRYPHYALAVIINEIRLWVFGIQVDVHHVSRAVVLHTGTKLSVFVLMPATTIINIITLLCFTFVISNLFVHYFFISIIPEGS